MPEKPDQQQRAEDTPPLCAYCAIFARESRATTELGGRPICGYCFEREVAYNGQ